MINQCINWKRDEQWDVYIVLKQHSQDSYKEKKYSFATEKSDRDQLNQVIKLHKISNGINQNHVPLDKVQGQEQSFTSAEDTKLILIKRKHQINSISKRDILQNNWPAIFKSVKFLRIKESLRDVSRLKRTKEI